MNFRRPRCSCCRKPKREWTVVAGPRTTITVDDVPIRGHLCLDCFQSGAYLPKETP